MSHRSDTLAPAPGGGRIIVLVRVAVVGVVSYFDRQPTNQPLIRPTHWQFVKGFRGLLTTTTQEKPLTNQYLETAGRFHFFSCLTDGRLHTQWLATFDLSCRVGGTGTLPPFVSFGLHLMCGGGMFEESPPMDEQIADQSIAATLQKDTEAQSQDWKGDWVAHSRHEWMFVEARLAVLWCRRLIDQNDPVHPMERP